MAGQVNVSVNLNPGTEKMDSVVVQLNGKTAATQLFSAAQAALLRSAADGSADQALQSTLVFAVNTAAYNTTTGAVTFPNGAAVFTVIGYGHQALTPASNSVTSQGYLLGNVDAWIVAQTFGAGTNTATSAAGFVYQGGPTASVSVTAIPVLYSGGVIASANVNFGNAACETAGLQRTQPLTAPVAPSSAWTATFARTATGTAHAVDVNGYEFNGAACPVQLAAGGEGAVIASSLYTTNTTGPTAFANASPGPLVRLDNLAPGTPSLLQNPRVRQNAWLNGIVSLYTFVSTTQVGYPAGNLQDRVVVKGTADGGVGGDAAWLRVGSDGTLATAVAATASNALTVGTGAVAPTLANTSLCGLWTERDLLGNESPLPAAPLPVCTAPVAGTNTVLAANYMQFGVDIAIPTIKFQGGLVAGASGVNGATGASVSALGQFQVAVLDTGSIGNSGMQATGPVLATVTIRSAAAGLTALQTCPVGTVNTSNVCVASATGMAAPAFPLVATALTGGNSNIIGYYTYTGTGIDAAGNVSTPVSMVVAYNPAANVPTVSGSIFNTPLNGPTATFNATGSSGNTTANSATTFFDLWEAKYNLTYSNAVVAGPLVYPPTAFNTFNSTTLVNQNVPVAITIPFVRQIQNQSSACNAALTVGATGIPNALNETLVDQVGNASAVATTGIIAAQVSPGTSYLGAPAVQQLYTSIVGNGVTEQPTGGCPLAAAVNAVKKVSGGGTSADAASIVLENDVWGPTATFAQPFSQVNFYVLVGGNLEQIGTTSTYTQTDDGSANGRKYAYTLSWTPGAKSPVSGTAWAVQSSAACAVPTGTSIYALGISAAGDGLLTPVSNNICITTAP
jgi:hypothetical protein